MRPLHSLLVVVALLLLAAGGWLLLRSGDPAVRITAAGPAASLPELAEAGDRGELRALDEEPEGHRSQSAAAAPAAAPSGSHGTDAAPAAALAGRVLDPEGDPVAGARVLLSEGSAGFLRGTALDSESAGRLFDVRETASDAEGRFRFEGVAADALRVAVRAKGYAPYDAVDVPRPAASRLADIVLEHGVRLAGRVVDAAGRPVEGVEVQRVSQAGNGPFRFGGQSAKVGSTARDGSFEVDVLAVGPWSLAFESELHPHATLEGRTERPGERVEGLLVELAEGAAISGRVTGDLPDGRDLARLRVSAAPLQGEDLPEAEARSSAVAADGSFSVRGVRAGRRYVLRAVEAEGPLDDMPFAFLPGVAAAVQADAGESGVVLVLSPEAALRFAVVDAGSGAPVEEFRVEAGVDWSQPLMDDQGRVQRRHPGGLVRVGDLRPRSSGERASLRIEALGYRPYEASDLKLTPGLDTDLGTIALEPAPLLTVRVLDALTGAPIAGADVQLSEVLEPEVEPAGMRRARASVSIRNGDFGARGDGERSESETGDDGRARLNALAGRDVRLGVRASGYAPSLGAPFRGSSEAEEREVRLTGGGAVVVHLFDAAGEPMAGGRVEHRAFHDEQGLPEFRSPALTDEEGEARFEHLAPGRHRFRRAGSESGGVFSSGGNTFSVMVGGMDDGSDDDWVEVDVVEGGEHELEIHLPLSLAVHGRLTEAGEPLAGASLSLVAARATPDGMPPMPMFGGGPQVESDPDGRWRFDGVEPGEYTLRISHPERAMPSEVALEVVDSEVQRDVDLDLAILEGRVLDPAGKPLAGVEVWSERARAEGAPRMMRVMAFAGSGGNVMTLDSGGGMPVRARTDADGRYVLRGVLSGVELELRGRGDGLQPGRSERVRLAADEHRRGLDLALETAGWIEVEGLYADGSPAASLLITARYEGAKTGVEPQTILLDDTGHGRLDGLAPGPWRITARAMGPGAGAQAPSELSVDVAAGAATPATVMAP